MSDLAHLVIVNILDETTTYAIEDPLCPIGIPAWAPNSKMIAFVSNFCTGNSNTEILTFDIETQKITKLTDNTSSNYLPVWAPDGKQIAFVSTRDGNEEIYLMQNDGSNQVNLTNSPANDSLPSWQP